MQAIRIITTVMGLFLICTTGYAGEIQRLTLGEAIKRGLERNNQAKAARFKASAARSGSDAASTHYLPTVNIEENWSASNTPVSSFMMKLNQGGLTSRDFEPSRLNNPATATDFRTAITIEQPMFVPSAWAAKKAATSSAEKQEATAEHAGQQTAFQIFELYLEVRKTSARLQATEKGLEEAKESSRQASARRSAGLGLKSDELRAATHLATMEQQHISAANNLTLARMRLALATGGEPGDEVDALEAPFLKPPVENVKQLVEIANNRRSDLHASERSRDEAEAMLIQARSGFLPTLGAFGSWQMNDRTTPFGRDHDSWMAGVSLRWNIFDGFRSYHGISQATANRAAAKELLEHSRKEVTYQVYEAWHKRAEAEKRLSVASSSLASADEAFRLLSKRFDNALATIAELLDAQSSLNQSRANLVESEANMMLATGRLHFAAGIFLKEVQ